MDSKQIVEITGLTYGQLNYLIDQVDALKRDKTQGKARDFTFRELVYLKLAAVMRADGIRLDEINQAIQVVEDVNSMLAGGWQWGTLIRRNDKAKLWTWSPNTFFSASWYNPTTNKLESPMDILRAIGPVYDVGEIASDLAGANQMIFEFAQAEKEAMKGN